MCTTTHLLKFYIDISIKIPINLGSRKKEKKHCKNYDYKYF